jgi:hypothetical protein
MISPCAIIFLCVSVRINEELLEKKVAAPVYKTEINSRGGSSALITRHRSIRKSWH